MIGRRKDGGEYSTVHGWFLEHKRLATLAVLRFDPGTREAFHDHAFNCVSLILGPGHLEETFLGGHPVRVHKPGTVLVTRREDFHQVRSVGTTYLLTLRGPWLDRWHEVDELGHFITLTHGRRQVAA